MRLWGQNAEVLAYVPDCAKRVNAAIWAMARNACDTAEAYKILRVIEDDLPIPLPKPWTGSEIKITDKIGFLSTTSHYSKGYTDPAGFDHRDTEPSRITPEFSPGAEKPKPKRRRRRRLSKRSRIAQVMEDGSYQRLAPPRRDPAPPFPSPPTAKYSKIWDVVNP
jgi:hypothetical protein